MTVVEQHAPTRTAPAAPAARPLPSTAATVLAVVRHGLREGRRSMLTWGISFGIYGAFMAAIYPSVSDAIDTVTESYPSGLMEAFGADDMTTAAGYIHAEMFSVIVPLALALYAARAIMRMVVGAEERGELDVLLALPLSRRALVAGAAITTWITTLGILLITGVLTWLAAQVSGADLAAGDLLAGVVGVLPIAVVSAGVAAVAAGFVSRAGTIAAIAMGTMVAMYAVDLAGRLVDALDPVRAVTAFKYYGAPLTDGLDVSSFVGLLAAAVLLTAAGAVLFDRRDVR